MSAKTKIVVLQMKEVIYTAIFAVLGVLLIILFIYMFLPKDKSELSKNLYIVCFTSKLLSLVCVNIVGSL